MNRQLYIKQLRLQLRGLPAREVEEIIREYEDYFNEACASGLTESQIIEQLGTPQIIASNLKGNKQMQQPLRRSSIEQVIILIVLIFFNLTIVLGPTVGLIAAFFGFIAATALFLLTPFLTLGGIIFGYNNLFEFFLSFCLAGIGLLLIPVWKKLSIYSVHLARRYIEWNKKLVRGNS